MDPEELQDLVAAMLSPDATPEEIAEIGQMVEEDDLPDTPDEDDGPVNEAAANNLRKWMEDRAIASAKAKLPPAKPADEPV